MGTLDQCQYFFISVEVMGHALYKLISDYQAKCNRQHDEDDTFIVEKVDKNIGIEEVGATVESISQSQIQKLSLLVG